MPDRVIFTTPYFLPAKGFGGVPVSVNGLARSIQNQNIKSLVLTTNAGLESDPSIPKDESVFNLKGLEVMYFKRRGPKPLFYAPNIKTLLMQIAAESDVIHANGIFLWPTYAAYRCAVKKNIPFILSARGMYDRFYFKQKGGLKKNLWHYLTGRQILKGASALHATSSQEADELISFGADKNKIRVIPNGHNFSSVKKTSTAGEKQIHIIYLGRLSPEKQVDRLIQAVKKGNKYRLSIYGNGGCAYVDYLRQLSAPYKQISFFNEIPPEGSGELIARHDLTVIPSMRESFCNTVLESLAASTPVLITDHVGVGEWFRQKSFCMVYDGSVNALQSSLDNFASNRELICGELAAQTDCVSGFGWDRVSESFASLYKEVRR